MDIGNIIKEKRTENNLTQEELAQKFFVTRQLISKWENGKSYPDLKQVVQLSELFGISLERLMKEDTEMVEELNFDTKRKKLFKLFFLLITIIVIGVVSFFGIIWWINPIFLTADDIQITKITKKVLPEKEMTIARTGEKVTLPEDVEYTIHFKTKGWLINLSNTAGMKEYSDETGILVGAQAEHHLYSHNKESTIVIKSDRESKLFDPDLNSGKSIYLQNMKKTSQWFEQHQKKMDFPSISQSADKIADIKELNKLPNN